MLVIDVSAPMLIRVSQIILSMVVLLRLHCGQGIGGGRKFSSFALHDPHRDPITIAENRRKESLLVNYPDPFKDNLADKKHPASLQFPKLKPICSQPRLSDEPSSLLFDQKQSTRLIEFV